MCSLSLDPLTGCQSLIEILCLVDLKDILNCKLVNRRFRDVIWRNDVIMPRKTLGFLTIHAHFGNWSRPPGIAIFFGLKEENGRTFLYIMDHIIKLDFSSSKSIRRHFKENGDIMEGISLDTLGVEENDNSISDVVCPVNGVENGLRFLLSYLFRRYHIEKLTLKDVDPWYDLIAEQFKAHRTKCKNAIIHDAWPSIDKFSRDIDPELTCVSLRDALSILVNVDGIWNRPVNMDLLEFDETSDLFKPAISLVKKWLAGRLRIFWLTILKAAPFVEEFKKQVLASTGFRPVVYFSKGARNEQFAIRRPSDDVVLFLTLGSEIELHDDVFVGQIPFAD